MTSYLATELYLTINGPKSRGQAAKLREGNNTDSARQIFCSFSVRRCMVSLNAAQLS